MTDDCTMGITCRRGFIPLFVTAVPIDLFRNDLEQFCRALTLDTSEAGRDREE